MSSAMVKLGDVINVHYGKALKADQRVSNGSVHVFGSSGIVGNHDKTLCSYPTIIIGRKGSVGAITWLLTEVGSLILLITLRSKIIIS